MKISLRADDRVLFLAVPPLEELAAIGRILINGVAVALASGPEELDTVRKTMADFENIMVIDAAPDRIPWREQYFTKIFVPPHFEAILSQIQAELHRILAPDGQIIRTAAVA